MNDYKFFYGGVFSQWHLSKFKIADITYNCAEQYMMYTKAILFKYTNNDIKLIKDNSSSIDIGIYKFESDSILKDWNKFGQLFIKGSGLVKV